MSYHQPYTMNGNRSAKVKGFMGLPRSLNAVMRAQLQDVQVFKTEKAAVEKYFNKFLGN
jgi:hypothetical protein|nr:MAG TPA: hypothetical protein [Caudoviricetes sp.]